MKIFEITDTFKVLQSNPQGIKLAAQNGTEISLPNASGLIPDPQNPKASTLDLSKIATGQQTMGQPATGQVATSQPGQAAPAPQAATGQQPMGQPATGQAGEELPFGQQQQSQLPQVGSEVELAKNLGMQAETFDDEDLIDSGENEDIGGPNGGDKTDDFIDDVVDHKWEKNAGRNDRNVVQPTPVRESAELIAMLTIAGLR